MIMNTQPEEVLNLIRELIGKAGCTPLGTKELETVAFKIIPIIVAAERLAWIADSGPG